MFNGRSDVENFSIVLIHRLPKTIKIIPQKMLDQHAININTHIKRSMKIIIQISFLSIKNKLREVKLLTKKVFRVGKIQQVFEKNFRKTVKIENCIPTNRCRTNVSLPFHKFGYRKVRKHLRTRDNR